MLQVCQWRYYAIYEKSFDLALRTVKFPIMFHDVPNSIKERMVYLESLNKKQRTENTPSSQRLRQIPPETGKFLTILAACAPLGTYLEIGTSGGYSALWISLACQKLGRTLVTIEIDEQKIEIAKETFKLAGIEDVIELIHGDGREYINAYHDISFCFLDADKGLYSECYEKIVPNMVQGGVLIADNVISHKDILSKFMDRALNDDRIDGVVVPIGSGELVCCKV